MQRSAKRPYQVPSHPKSACSFETLARGNVLTVQRCTSCDTLSFHLGPVTLRFDAAAAESIWNTLGQALGALHADKIEEEEAPPVNVLREQRVGRA